MQWKPFDQLLVSGLQTVFQVEPVSVGDSVLGKQRLFESHGSTLEDAGKVHAWSWLMSMLLEENGKEYSAFTEERYRTSFGVDFSSDEGLPPVALRLSAGMIDTISQLSGIDAGEVLLEVVGWPHWRLMFPDLSAIVSTEEEAGPVLERHLARIPQQAKFISDCAALCSRLSVAARDCSARYKQLGVEEDFWASVINGQTSLQRWFRSFGGADGGVAQSDGSDQIGPVLASMERLDRYSRDWGAFGNLLEALNQPSAGGWSGYSEILIVADEVGGRRCLNSVEASRLSQQVQLAILQCDWNQAVTSLEALDSTSSEHAARAAQWLVCAFNALQAEADFVNVNMLLDCCGDRFPGDAANLEELRARADRSSVLMDHVSAANGKPLRFVPKAELLELRSLGIETPGVSAQWRRRRTVSIAAMAVVVSLFVSLAAGGLYLSRDFGNANVKLAMAPPASFEAIDILLLPKFDRAARLAADKTETELGVGSSSGREDRKSAGSMPSQESQTGVASKTLNAAGREAKIADLLRKQQANVGREIAALEEKFDDQQSSILAEKKQEVSRVQKAREAATDASQEEFASLRQTRFRTLSGKARQTAEDFVKLLDQITMAVSQDVKDSMALHNAAIKASPVYQRYGVGWRVNATIGGKVAVGGLKLFPSNFPISAAGAWTVSDAQNLSKFSSEQLQTLEGSSVVFSAQGVNIDPPYESSSALHTGRNTKPLHEKLKLLSSQVSEIVSEFEKIETDIQTAQKAKTLKAEEAFEKQLSEIETKFKDRLAQVESQRAAELGPMEQRRASLAQEGRGALTGAALAELFDELWKSDGVLKTTSSSGNFNFGFQPRGDYQVLARARKASGQSFYSSDFGLPPLFQNVMSIAIPMKVTLMQDGVAPEPPAAK